MKKIFTTITALIASLSLFSQNQIINGDFEAWTLIDPDYTVYTPNSWGNGAACASIGNQKQCTFKQDRTTDAHSGSYAVIQYTSVGFSSINYSSLTSYVNSSTFAFTGRPKSVTFYYKYVTDDHQPVKYSFSVFTGNVSNPTIIGLAEVTISETTNGYQKATADFVYSSQDVPTNILITNKYVPKPTTALDTLNTDDITFQYDVQAIEDEILEIEFNLKNDVLTSSDYLTNVYIYDLIGNVVANYPQSTNIFNLSSLNNGLYIVKGFKADIPFVKKIALNK